VAVNVSARQLQDPGFFDDAREALVRSGLDAGALTLEIAEPVLVADVIGIVDVMAKMRELGVRLALDDFGTGYASLLYLKGLPVDRLKVDRSFVAGLGGSQHDPTIVAAVVDLAHKLGLAVVAEGVETESELRAVREMGCDEAQGFLLGRPGPPSRTFAGDEPAGDGDLAGTGQASAGMAC
jgi:EAL domain-containing protein (putative c-di-GMP-specific phosphodiesterase class I)